MKKIMKTVAILMMTTALFSCGHMHHGGAAKGESHAHGCNCDSEKSDSAKSDTKKGVCEHCQKGS
jgi:hypothetical protein